MAPDDSYPDDRCPGAPYPFFAGYRFRPTRRQRRAWPSLRGSVARDGTEGRTWARGRPRTGRGTRSTAVRRPGATRASGRAGGPIGKPSRIGPPCGGTARSGARTYAPKHQEADPARGRSRGGCGPQIHSLADLRGRPLRLRVTGGPRPDRTQARALGEDGTDAPRPCLIADRACDRDGFRAWRAQRGIESVLPARRGRLNPQPHDPEKYKARKAVARGFGGLEPWRRVATRYDKHAPQCLGFLYWAAAWIGLKP